MFFKNKKFPAIKKKLREEQQKELDAIKKEFDELKENSREFSKLI